jgi:rod shape-determining protein MreB
MIVDIGGGTTDIAVISLAGIVYSKAVRVAGNEMDEAIIQHQEDLQPAHRRTHRGADQDGSRLGVSARRKDDDGDQGTAPHRGRAQDHHRLGRGNSRGAGRNRQRDRGRGARRARTHTPELSADIVDRGIVLTGGGSLLKNLDKRLREETGLPLAMAEDPLSSVVLGAGKMLSDFNLLRKISID